MIETWVLVIEASSANTGRKLRDLAVPDYVRIVGGGEDFHVLLKKVSKNVPHEVIERIAHGR